MAEVTPKEPEAGEVDTSRLSAVLDGHENILVFCHMNPDPDSIASALAMQLLLETRFGKKTQLCYRGIIGRAQNREMVRLLAPDLKKFNEIESEPFTGAVLVDAQPEFGFEKGVELDQQDVPILICVDHHPFVDSTLDVPFYDVRPGLGATATIMANYLKLFSVEPSSVVATALYYGIKTDTLALTRRTTEADKEAYEMLLPQVDHEALSHIESPPLSQTYFGNLDRAIVNARVHGNLVLTHIGGVDYPDMVAEIADLFLKVDLVHWSVCTALFEGKTFVSIRTSDPEGDAGVVIRDVVGEMGMAGGHNTMAAARLPMDDDSTEAYMSLDEVLRNRFLERLGQEGEDPVELVEY